MDYKLKVFKEVAFTRSFTKAAQRLNLSQPAVSKTIKNLEIEYEQAFFERKRNSIELTAAGSSFLEYVEKILDIYDQIDDEFSANIDQVPSHLKIGASTTVANYLVPELVAQLQKEKPELQLELIIGNTDEIQQQILNKQLDIGIVEGENHNHRLAYKKFIRDELVLVKGVFNPSTEQSSLSLSALNTLNFIEREYGSGTRDVIEKNFKNKNLSLPKAHSTFGSTESIKSYLQHTDSCAFLSIHAVRNELLNQKLELIEIEDLTLYRWFYFITRQGYPTKKSNTLYHHLIKSYNKK